MEWSPKQRKALDAVASWQKSGSAQVFRVFGYAGTGKTTLAKHFAESAGRVQFATFTGKAAHVLRTKGCNNACTIHSLIYQPLSTVSVEIQSLTEQIDGIVAGIAESGGSEEGHEELAMLREKRTELAKKQKGGPRFALRPDSPEIQDCDLLCIDEVSMVGEEMAHDLLSFGRKILVLGDPAQLPPVRGFGYFTETEPDILLDEIHRQARDNPIIDMATRVRAGESLPLGNYGDSRHVARNELDREDVMGADQVLVGRNATRKAYNGRMRTLLGRGDSQYPVPGDKIVCLRNDHQVGLLNGSLWEVTSASQAAAGRIALGIAPLDGIGIAQEVVAHSAYFEGSEPGHWEAREAQCFDYGYALTTHKAQGSQWDKVTVFDESACFRADASRWLYTAITRAAERVTVVAE